MYQINDIIVYENGGVCKIKDIGVPDFLKTNEQYYKMQPVSNDGGTIYVKTNNDKIIMRLIISREEAEDFLLELPRMEALYDENDKIRQKEFHDIIKSCECKQYFQMLKGIMIERSRKIKDGKKLNMNDEKILQKVEKLLSEEYSMVFNISMYQAKIKIKDAMLQKQIFVK